MKPEVKKRRKRAYERGREDYGKGVPFRANPLELAGNGVAEEWERGWRDAEKEGAR